MRSRLPVLLAGLGLACGDAGAGAGDPPPPAGTTAPPADASSGELAPTSTGGPGPVSDAWMTHGDAATDTTADATTDVATDTTADATTDAPDACPRLRVVTPGDVLNVRPTPSTAGAPVAELADGTIVDKVAEVEGEAIDGNALWYQITSPLADGYVFSAFVACTADEPPPAPEGFYLPLACGMQAKVTQGNDGDVSHQGKDFYAFDFGLGLGTPLHAMAAGVVQHVYAETMPGDPCYDGGGPECGPYGNLVVVLHGDGTASYYKHLSEVHVVLGQQLARADVVGLSGSTGYSTGPHAHIMRQENCGAPKCQSIPLSFVECGVPATGDVVTSMNCP
jgi:murein DD-endopeptidase MepM/ murein hydrolase activator NlpD